MGFNSGFKGLMILAAGLLFYLKDKFDGNS